MAPPEANNLKSGKTKSACDPRPRQRKPKVWKNENARPRLRKPAGFSGGAALPQVGIGTLTLICKCGV